MFPTCIIILVSVYRTATLFKEIKEFSVGHWNCGIEHILKTIFHSFRYIPFRIIGPKRLYLNAISTHLLFQHLSVPTKQFGADTQFTPNKRIEVIMLNMHLAILITVDDMNFRLVIVTLNLYNSFLRISAIQKVFNLCFCYLSHNLNLI